MDASQLKIKLLDDIDNIVRYLLPNAKRNGGYYCVGNTAGDKGESLRINTGSKKGVWLDGKTGETGDIFDLWKSVRGLEDFEATYKEVLGYYGITATPIKFHSKTTEKVYKRPAEEVKPITNKVRHWLTSKEKGVDYDGRWLSSEIVDKYKVGSEGDYAVFPYYNEKGELVNLKKRNIYNKKDMQQFGGGEPILFGWQAISADDRVIVITEGECFPSGAQVLTPNGWVNLENYNNELVAQYNEGGKLEFVKPLAYIKKHYQGNLIRHDNKGWVSITTPEHNLVSLDRKGRLRKHHANNILSRVDTIPRVGKLDGDGINLNDDQIRLIIAISADARIDERSGTGRVKAKELRYARFGLKKERKKERLRNILNNLGMQYSDNPIKEEGYHSICFSIPDWISGRFFDWSWMGQLSMRQRDLILEELPLWDGNFVPNRDQYEYSSKYKENIDWVQALAHTAGRCSTIIKRKNAYGEWYKVSILNKKTTSSWQTVTTTEVPHSDFVYCVTIPSGMLMVRQENRITITGNCDAMAVAHYGYPALSVPMGGGGGGKQTGWLEREYERLLRFEKIYIAMDADETGREAIADIIDRLGRDRCFVVDFGEASAKDANELLMDGMEKVYFDALMETARTLDPDELKSAYEYQGEVWKYIQNPAILGLKLPFSETQEEFGIRPSELTIWSGFSGSGKSQLLGHVIVDLMAQGERACIASMELTPAILLSRMEKQIVNMDLNMIDLELHRKVFNWLEERLWLFNVLGTAKTDQILEVFKYARKRYGVTQFVIDSLTKCGIGSDDYKGQKAFVDKLCDFKHEHNVHIHLVAHSRKLESEEKEAGKMDIKGDSGITDLADNIMMVWRNKKKENEFRKLEHLRDDKIINQADVILSCHKQRNGNGDEGRYSLSFEKMSNRYFGEKDVHINEMPYVR